MPGRRILITGIASYLGTELARRLESDPEVEYVAGLDTRKPNAACEKADSVRAIVIRGSAGIYGAEPAAPQFFTEDMAHLYPLRTRFQRDIGEIENLFETYRRRHPRVTCTMLRYQPTIGPGHDTQVTRYLSLPVVPTYLGFDPRLQFVHERDALEAFIAAVKSPVRGAVNVAAPGTIGLTRMIRMAGKMSVPIAPPLFPGVATA